jgi:glucose-fructose oxidoreductase
MGKIDHISIKSRRSFIRKTVIGTAAVLSASATPALLRPKQSKRMGIALVGLGYYSRDLLSPALQKTSETYLAGIVTGSSEKAKTWTEKYKISEKNIYNYSNFDEIANNDDIQIVYIVLPNFMHREYTIRAAAAGKHVICEKPMALNADECRDMIAACKDYKVKLSIGYRMHYEPNTQEIMKMGQESVFGQVRQITGGAGFYMTNFNNWRMKKDMGGGAMMDMGVYPLNAARYITGKEPVSVSAQVFNNRPDIFTEVDEIISFQLEFPEGIIANLISGFNANYNYIRAKAKKGWFSLDPFSSYGGIKGLSSKGQINFPEINQQATQMDEFALSIKNKTPLRVTGEEGLKDMIVVDGIKESIVKNGKTVYL